jgi:archaellum biogenesis ATPase FlaH
MDTENAVIMFDGIEYLTLFNDFQKVQMFVEEVNDMIMTSESILLMPVDPEALDGRSIARISRYTEII